MPKSNEGILCVGMCLVITLVGGLSLAGCLESSSEGCADWDPVEGCLDCGALSEYNDTWRGRIELDDGRTFPVTLDLLVTRFDLEIAPTEWHNLWQDMYGRLTLEKEGFVLALVGEADHWDFVSDLSDAHSALGGREFVNLNIRDFNWCGDHAPASPREDYLLFSDEVGVLEGRETNRFSFHIAAERLSETKLDGIIYELSSDGIPDDDGWIRSTPRPRGRIVLHRVGSLPEEIHRDERTVVAEPFVFETGQVSDEEYSQGERWSHGVRVE